MIKILVAGDFVPMDRTAVQVDAKDFSCLSEVKPFAQDADYAVLNFESPVVIRKAKPIDKTGPNLRCSEWAMQCVAQAGFNCITLANNHFRDYGQEGVEDTLSACQKYGVDYVGGGMNRNDAGDVLYKSIKESRLAILNFCESEWSIAGTDYGGSNPLDLVRNYRSICEARDKVDYVLVIVHGGIEAYQYPTPRMVATYRFFIDAGADVVVNHHQHCFSGYETYHGKPIFYGLGNFCFDRKEQRRSMWNEGYMVGLLLDKNHIDYEIIPYVQCDDIPKVLPMDKERKKGFDETIDKINKIISDEGQLNRQFQMKIDSMYESRLEALEPFTSRIIRFFQRKHLFPRLVQREQRKSMLMRVRCESNRETLIGVLMKYFDL